MCILMFCLISYAFHHALIVILPRAISANHVLKLKRELTCECVCVNEYTEQDGAAYITV